MLQYFSKIEKYKCFDVCTHIDRNIYKNGVCTKKMTEILKSRAIAALCGT